MSSMTTLLRCLGVIDMAVLEDFKKEIKKLARKYHRGGVNYSTAIICVRHFIHPENYHLGKEMQRIAAVEMREITDSDGMWPACKGELWWDKVLNTPQVRPPDQHPAELLVHRGDFISQTNCGRYIAGTHHLKGREGEEIYGKLMVVRGNSIASNCPECERG